MLTGFDRIKFQTNSLPSDFDFYLADAYLEQEPEDLIYYQKRLRQICDNKKYENTHHGAMFYHPLNAEQLQILEQRYQEGQQILALRQNQLDDDHSPRVPCNSPRLI